MQNPPKVSVVIPCYNHGKFVDEAVESVLEQTFSDFEIIIVNDGSTDERTNTLLQGYNKPKTRVLTTDNQGLAAARNNGIREAKGEYILPLDADDRIAPTYLEKAVRMLDQSQDIGIVYCRARLFGELDSEWILPEYSLDVILLDNVIFCSSLFRKAQWEEVGGYDPEFIYGWEDWDFWLSLIEQGCLVYKIPEVLFYYRITADSMVRSTAKEQKVETLGKIYNKHIRLFSDNIHIWANKVLDRPEESYVTRLYVDTGDGFNEEQTLTQKLSPLSRSITFDVSAFKKVVRLRFHPVNDYCAIHLNRVSLESETGYTVELEDFQANTIDQNLTNLVFTNNTPYVQFELPDLRFHTNRISRFSVSINFLRIGKEAFFYLLKRKDEQVAREQRLREEQQQEVRRLKSRDYDKPAASLTWKEMAKLAARKAKSNLSTAKYSFNPAYRAISKSGLFDREYYFANNRDLQANLLDPIVHYLEHGHKEGRNPNPLFETGWYWQAYPDVAEQGINPLYHYAAYGWKQGKNPCAMFESEYYLRMYPEVKQAGQTPLAHFMERGARNGYKPNPLFDTAYYLANSPDVAEGDENPLVHYIRTGVWEGRPTRRLDESFPVTPVISLLVPVYNVDAPYLRACIESVLDQVYEHWELCLADDASPAAHIRPLLEEYANLDPRIKVRYLDKNQGISGATNAAANLASGEYLGFLDNDDELTRDALLEVVRAINQQQADLVYSDECIVNSEGEYLQAHHKPDFSPDLLLSHNYITHFLVMRNELFHKVGGVSSACDGAQDYDLLLKTTEQAKKIVHIPKILYRWRTLETSTSANPGAKSYADTAGKHALETALERRKIKGEVYYSNLPFYYRVQRTSTQKPLVSILIPFCDQPDYLDKCVTSILERTTYSRYEVVGISNNSKEDVTFRLMERLSKKDERIRFIEYNQPFNYSAINNFGVGATAGEHLVLMNNDIEVLNTDWLESLLEHSLRPEVGAVGAKLYYPDNTIQHAGVIIGIGGFAGHGHRHFPRKSPGYFNRLFCTQNVSAVTAALLMVKRFCYQEVGGLDEEHLGVALNDVDFCLKLRAKGYLNIWTPHAEAIHYESVSRGYEDTPAKKKRFEREVDFFKKKWRQVLDQGDPYYNVNLSLDREDFAKNSYLTWFRSRESRQAMLDAETGR